MKTEGREDTSVLGLKIRPIIYVTRSMDMCSFCEYLDGLNYSLSNLYLGRMLGLDDRLGM